MKQSDNYCDYITRLDLKQVGFIEDGERSELSKDNTYLPAPTWLEALEWLEKQFFRFEFILSDEKSISVYGNILVVFYNGSILPAIQIAVKEGITILKEQSK